MSTIYIVAGALAAATRTACSLPDAVETRPLPGSALDRATFQHPFLDRLILGVNADYVTTEQGTGAVHTAPSHGADDFLTGTRYGLSQLCDVDATGRLRNGLPEYDGLQIFKANPVIIDLVRSRGALMGQADLHHSYPHCWRCHNPVIFRATEQWFISMETPMPATPDDPNPSGAPGLDSETWVSSGPPITFRQRALDEIKGVTWDPAWGEDRISNMISTRPDWCISRQRIWGVPIAVFLCERCHTPLNNAAVNQSIVDLFTREVRRRLVHPHRRRTSSPPEPPATTAARPTSARKWTSSTSGSSPAPAGTPSSTSNPSSPTYRLPRRPLHRGRRPASRLVPLFPAHLRRPARTCPVQNGRHLRLDPRRARPRLLEIARQRRRSRSTSLSASAPKSSASGSPPSTSAKTSPPAKT